MKKLITCTGLCVSLFLAGCHSAESDKGQHVPKDSSYTILGKITGQDTGTVYLMHHQSEDHLTDSVKLDHGYFTFKGKANEPEWCFLGILKDGEKNFQRTFFLQNGKMTVLANKDSLLSALISGTPVQDELNNYEAVFQQAVGSRMADLDKNYDAAKTRNDKKTMDSLDKQYDALEMEQKKMIIEYTKAHPDSYISAFEISRNFSYDPDPLQLDSLYKTLDAHIRSSYFGKKINDILTKARLTAVGQSAPGFTSSDTNGNPVSLASFKGKMVLVDFWASWCGPCRQENPAVVKAYQQFHPKGFNILGVSLDTKKEKWEEAIKKDGLRWEQVSDLKGWKSDAAALYGVEGIPMNFLLNKDGKIIARGLRGDDLAKKLQELLH